MTALRRASALVLAGALAVPLTPAVGAQAGNAPVAVDDHVVLPVGLYNEDVDVLANDTAADGGDLQVCRIEAPDDSALSVHIWSETGASGDYDLEPASTYLMLEANEELPTGTYTVRYYACDKDLLSPATLTVEVRAITATAVEGSPGTARFTNPLLDRVWIAWAYRNADDLAGSIRLRAGESRDVEVGARRLVWLAYRVRDMKYDDPLPAQWGRLRADGDPAAPAPTGTWGPTSIPPYDPDTAPVTASDQVTVDYYDSVDVDVLANDTDDHAGDLGICRVDVPTDVGLSALPHPWWGDSDRARSDDPDRYLGLSVNAASGGTYTITYYACDRHQMTPGTLTVTVREFPEPRVRRVIGRPGVIEVTNGGYRAVSFQYSRPGDSRGERLRVPPGESRRIRVQYDTLTYYAASRIGPLGWGRVRDVQQDG